MKDHATVLHHVPGRMRLRVPSAKGNANRLEQLRRELMPLNGVRQITTNPSIGTIIIDYHAALFAQFPRQLAQLATERDLLSIEDDFKRGAPRESATDKALEEFAGNVNRKIQKLTGNAINLKEVFPFSIILYAMFFVDRAINASQWLNWVQFAFSSYIELHENEPVVKVGAEMEALRAEIAEMHRESLETITRQIAGVENAVRELARQVGNGRG